MKILVLNYEYPPVGGGGGAVCKELCEKAFEDGNDIEVVTMNCGDLKDNEIINNIKIHRINSYRKSMRSCNPLEQLIYCFKAYFYINKNLDLNSYDFIHTHFIIPSGILTYFLHKKKGIRYIVTAHGSDVLGHNKSRFAFLYKLVKSLWIKILKEATYVTAPSNYLIDEIHDSYKDVNVTLIPNGINVKEYKSGKKENYILVLTRLQKFKGVQKLFEAYTKINNRKFQIKVAGDGPYREDLEKLAEELGIKDNVEFLGHTQGQNKLDLLAKAKIFFSGSEFEAFPISVLEASLSGCDIIASDIEPHKLLVGEKHIYHDEDELVKMLDESMNRRNKKFNYGTEIYDWSNIYEQYKELYLKVGTNER